MEKFGSGTNIPDPQHCIPIWFWQFWIGRKWTTCPWVTGRIRPSINTRMTRTAMTRTMSGTSCCTNAHSLFNDSGHPLGYSFLFYLLKSAPFFLYCWAVRINCFNYFFTGVGEKVRGVIIVYFLYFFSSPVLQFSTFWTKIGSVGNDAKCSS